MSPRREPADKGQGGRGRQGQRLKPLSRRRLSEEHKLTLLAVAIRNPTVFEQAAARLTVEHLTTALPTSSAYAVLWRAVSEFYAEHGCLPPREALELTIQGMVDEAPEILSEEEIEDVELFLDEAFDEDRLDPFDKGMARWSEGCLRHLLNECLVDRAARLIRAGDEVVAADLPALLDNLSHEAHGVATIGVTGLGAPVFSPGWEQQTMAAVRPSRVDLIDALIGGEVPGEVYVYAGPYGSCKSLLALHACIRAARYWQRFWLEQQALMAAGKTPEMTRRPVVVYVSYEMPLHEFRRRVLANSARIPYSRLMKLDTLDKLRRRSLGSYEKRVFRSQIDNQRKVRFERQRADLTTRLINEHMMFIDMSGKDKDLEHYGQDGVPELTRVMRSLFPADGDRWPVVMWVDHTAEMADEYAIANNIDEKQKIAMLRMVPKSLAKLGSHYGFPVHQIHQLSGEANEKGPTGNLSLTDMEGCKSLGRSADFVLLINKPTADGRAIISVKKHRRFKPKQTERVIKINGSFMKVRLDDEYVIESSSRSIMPKAVAHDVARPAKVSKPSSLTPEEEAQG